VLFDPVEVTIRTGGAGIPVENAVTAVPIKIPQQMTQKHSHLKFFDTVASF
jgi:hypothetical protein